MWGQDQSGHLRPIKGVESIKLHPESNSIRFKLQVEGYIHAYVVGDFNNWEKIETFKLSWDMDHHDGHLKMINEVSFTNGIASGIHEYSYILVDIEGNETLISKASDTHKTFHFNWVEVIQHFAIKASENFVIPGFGLDLIAVRSLGYYHTEVIPAIWSFSPEYPGISLNENCLFIDKNIDGIKQITVTATNQSGTLTATRTFNILNLSRTGKLIHFIKSDTVYVGADFIWDLWTYDKQGITETTDFFGSSDFGETALSQNEFVIARKKSWGLGWQNDWSEQSYLFNLDMKSDNYYIIYGDPQVYNSLSDVITRTNPRVEYAVIDEKNKVTAYLSHEPLIGITFGLYINGVKQENVDAFIRDEKKQIIFTNLPQAISPSALVEVRANHTFLPCKVTMGHYLDNFYYANHDMGIIFNDSEISLRIWAPTAKKVELLIYQDWQSATPEQCVALNANPNDGTHHIILNRAHFEHKFYLYQLYFDDIDQNGQFYVKITQAVDPYANSLGINGDKGFLVDLNSIDTMPDNNWVNDIKPTFTHKKDAILYELHLRDFTIDPNSGVSESLRGKFAGAAMTNCQYVDNNTGNTVSTGIDSLVELGITHVHILPMFDFSSVDETRLDDATNRNWGYDPKNYNAPEGSYATDPYNPISRIKELRAMVQGFHNKGIRVVMDVVYNHMTVTQNFDNIVPKYYFRTDHLGRFTNGSGCGNELATESPMVGKFIIDSLLHWLNDYKIDGFRFDLMELMDIKTMKKVVSTIHQIDPSILIYGEPWKGGQSPLANGTHRGCQKNEGFAIFNDFFRDAIRGGNNLGNGFSNGGQHNALNTMNVVEGLQGSINNLTLHAHESINYADAHDNYTLWDHIEKSQNHSLANGDFRKHIPQNPFESTLVRQNLLALGIVITAQGIPFIHGGAEILRTKNGDHNSYTSSDEINAFHWADKLNFKPVFDYVRGLIKLRQSHPAFRMADKDMIRRHLCIYMAHQDDRSGVIVSHFKHNANHDSWKDIVVIYNGTSIDNYTINDLLPIPDSGIWHIVVNHERSGVETIMESAHGLLPPLKSYSMMVLHS